MVMEAGERSYSESILNSEFLILNSEFLIPPAHSIMYPTPRIVRMTSSDVFWRMYRT